MSHGCHIELEKKTSSITSFLIIGYHKIKFPWADNLLTQTTNIYPPPSPQALLYVQNEPSNLISVHVHWLLISSNFLNEYKIDVGCLLFFSQRIGEISPMKCWNALFALINYLLSLQKVTFSWIKKTNKKQQGNLWASFIS